MKLPRPSLRDWALLLLLLGATSAICVWQLRLVGDFRIDDAYITFSFSKNLAHGHGPVFSLGERVEGYSNFLWMVLLAVPYLCGAADASAFARVVSLATLLALAWVSYRLARRHARANHYSHRRRNPTPFHGRTLKDTCLNDCSIPASTRC